jgi:MFS family permease
MQSIGQSWLVLELTGSAFQLGLLTALQFLPILLLSPLGGALSDRYPKKYIVIWTQLVMMLQALGLAVLVATGWVRFWHVAVLATVYGIGRAIDIPARQSYVTDLVGRDNLHNAVVLNALVFNAARVVGPAVAGLLIAQTGIAAAFLVNALSFLAVLAALFAIRTRGDPHPEGRVGVVAGLRSAFAYAVGTPRVGFTLTLLGTMSLLVINFNVLVPIIARVLLKAGAQEFGFLMSSLGAGAVSAAVGLALFRRGTPHLRTLVVAATLLSAGTAALSVGGPLPLLAVLLAMLGCCQIIMTTGCNTTLQLATPPALRGRVMGLYSMVFAGMTPFGSLLIGAASERFGVRTAALISGCSGLAALALMARFARRAAAPDASPTTFTP